MVHADASNFEQGVSKEDCYEQLLLQAEGLFSDQRNWQPAADVQGISNLSNTAALLWYAYQSLPAPSSRVNWSGFYVLDHSSTNPQLILGPFQGKVACQTIAFGRGVCGVAAEAQETQLVSDVEQFPGHIACDGDSKSEIVVPIMAEKNGEKRVVAVMDVDCAEKKGFDEVDKKKLEQLAELIAKSCDW